MTSAYSSYSGCRQYRENLWASLDELGLDVGLGEGEHPLVVDKVRSYFNHPGFVQANVDAVTEAYESLGRDARLVFVTHSIPDTMEEASTVSGASYSAQHLDVAATVAAAVEQRLGRPVTWDLTYCSRSGPPSQPWLEPDVNDHLTALAADGRAGRGPVADRLHLGPHGGRVRPRHRGAGHGRGARARRRPRGHRRHPGAVRPRARRPRARAGRAGPARRRVRRSARDGRRRGRRRRPARATRRRSATCRRGGPCAARAAARCAPASPRASPPPARPTPGPDPSPWSTRDDARRRDPQRHRPVHDVDRLRARGGAARGRRRARRADRRRAGRGGRRRARRPRLVRRRRAAGGRRPHGLVARRDDRGGAGRLPAAARQRPRAPPAARVVGGRPAPARRVQPRRTCPRSSRASRPATT